MAESPGETPAEKFMSRTYESDLLSERCRLIGEVQQVCIFLPTCGSRKRQWPICAPGRLFFADLLRFGQLPVTVKDSAGLSCVASPL